MKVRTPDMAHLSAQDCAYIDSVAQELGFPHTLADMRRIDCEKPRLIMAPMAGVSDTAYRIMMRLAGAELAFSEMVSVAGLWHDSHKTRALYTPDEVEGPIAVQLFGHNAEQFSHAAREVYTELGERCFQIDINMACPVKKVIKKGEGAALLKTSDLAYELVAATHKMLPEGVPVTVKLRSGFDKDTPLTEQFIFKLKEAGATSITVHARLATEFYRGNVDHERLIEIARTSPLPVYVSGDMLSPDVVACALSDDRFAGVYVARGTLGIPWIFTDTLRIFNDDTFISDEHSAYDRVKALKLHLFLMEKLDVPFGRTRAIALWYTKGFPGASRIRQEITKVKQYDEYRTLLEALEGEFSC